MKIIIALRQLKLYWQPLVFTTRRGVLVSWFFLVFLVLLTLGIFIGGASLEGVILFHTSFRHYSQIIHTFICNLRNSAKRLSNTTMRKSKSRTVIFHPELLEKSAYTVNYNLEAREKSVLTFNDSVADLEKPVLLFVSFYFQIIDL